MLDNSVLLLFSYLLLTNFEFKSSFMVFSTCENVGEIFETLRQRLHRNCRARQFGHVRVTFPIGRLGVNISLHTIHNFLFSNSNDRISLMLTFKKRKVRKLNIAISRKFSRIILDEFQNLAHLFIFEHFQTLPKFIEFHPHKSFVRERRKTEQKFSKKFFFHEPKVSGKPEVNRITAIIAELPKIKVYRLERSERLG